nr:MAG TPA: hypothetical protein [Caudoviricetes sp.]
MRVQIPKLLYSQISSYSSLFLTSNETVVSFGS